jgi:hypothetical protein
MKIKPSKGIWIGLLAPVERSDFYEPGGLGLSAIDPWKVTYCNYLIREPASCPIATSSSSSSASSSPLAELFAAYGIPFLDDASRAVAVCGIQHCVSSCLAPVGAVFDVGIGRDGRHRYLSHVLVLVEAAVTVAIVQSLDTVCRSPVAPTVDAMANR